MEIGDKIKYKTYSDTKEGIIEWIEDFASRRPFRKIKLTNGDLITVSQIII